MACNAALVAIVTVLSSLVVTNICGNSLVCVIITRNQDMRCVKVELLLFYFAPISFFFLFFRAVICVSIERFPGLR